MSENEPGSSFYRLILSGFGVHHENKNFII